ncbi:MAG TPA: hypothetical protein VMP89_02430 [Solirubrobacteraceae bacterium]|nr:hypothetical protein [Solirubrobacteraceae bacterium]
MPKRSTIIALLCAGAVLVAGTYLAAPAGAAGISAPVADCIHNGQLTHHYTPAQLQNALNTMQSDITEYSNCKTVIQNALQSQIGTLKNGLGGGGGSFLPTWLLILLIILVLGGVAFVTAAIRRRGGGDEPPTASAA